MLCFATQQSQHCASTVPKIGGTRNIRLNVTSQKTVGFPVLRPSRRSEKLSRTTDPPPTITLKFTGLIDKKLLGKQVEPISTFHRTSWWNVELLGVEGIIVVRKIFGRIVFNNVTLVRRLWINVLSAVFWMCWFIVRCLPSCQLNIMAFSLLLLSLATSSHKVQHVHWEHSHRESQQIP